MEENLPQIIEPLTGTFLQQSQEIVAGYAKKSKSDNTWKAYQSDFEDFKQ